MSCLTLTKVLRELDGVEPPPGSTVEDIVIQLVRTVRRRDGDDSDDNTGLEEGEITSLPNAEPTQYHPSSSGMNPADSSEPVNSKTSEASSLALNSETSESSSLAHGLPCLLNLFSEIEQIRVLLTCEREEAKDREVRASKAALKRERKIIEELTELRSANEVLRGNIDNLNKKVSIMSGSLAKYINANKTQPHSEPLRPPVAQQPSQIEDRTPQKSSSERVSISAIIPADKNISDGAVCSRAKNSSECTDPISAKNSSAITRIDHDEAPVSKTDDRDPTTEITPRVRESQENAWQTQKQRQPTTTQTTLTPNPTSSRPSQALKGAAVQKNQCFTLAGWPQTPHRKRLSPSVEPMTSG